MSRPAAGLSFREIMAGGFAIGETSPVEGAAKGRAAAHALELHVAVVIDSVARFAADPEHCGRLEGHIQCGPLGGALTATGGLVKLFARPSAGGSKRMIYQLAVTSPRGPLYFAGEKHVGDRSVLHAWSETTTLYCRMHEGPTTEGPVVGAGVLHLTAWQFARQLGSFQSPGASAGARLAAMARFGRFFAGELIDSYL